VSCGRARDDEIAQAENGQAALQRFERAPCDGIVNDWSMPVMDGLTFVKRGAQAESADFHVDVHRVMQTRRRGCRHRGGGHRLSRQAVRARRPPKKAPEATCFHETK
jgi:CheY-like chemotaxis protein